MPIENITTYLKYEKTLKVIKSKTRQTIKGKEYNSEFQRIYIPHQFYRMLPKEIQDYNTVEVQFDPEKRQLIYTFRSPPADTEKTP